MPANPRLGFLPRDAASRCDSNLEAVNGGTHPGRHVGLVVQALEGRLHPDGLPAKDWLSFYASRFRTVELNTTFYRTPAESTFSGWHEQAPRGFLFAVKASRFITHIKRLNDVEGTVQRQMESVKALGAAVGPTLFQLPPTMERDLDRLRRLLEALPRRGRFAIEFRHESWDDGGVYELLARHHVGALPARLAAPPLAGPRRRSGGRPRLRAFSRPVRRLRRPVRRERAKALG